MSLRKLIKQNANVVLGVDSSTNSFAFCLFDGRPVKWGKLTFNGNDIYEKVIDCRNKMQFIKQEVRPDYICIESAIMVKSQAVAINMAMIVGVLVSELAVDSRRIITVPPSAWQNFIGNKNLTKIEKEDLKKYIYKNFTNIQKNENNFIQIVNDDDFFLQFSNFSKCKI